MVQLVWCKAKLERRIVARVECIDCIRTANAELAKLLRPCKRSRGSSAASPACFTSLYVTAVTTTAATNLAPAAALHVPGARTALGLVS